MALGTRWCGTKCCASRRHLVTRKPRYHKEVGAHGTGEALAIASHTSAVSHLTEQLSAIEEGLRPMAKNIAELTISVVEALTDATQVLRSDMGAADRHTGSLFQLRSSAGVQTTMDLKGSELTRKEDSANLAQLASRISAVRMFGAAAGEKVAVAGFIANHKSRCDG